jgi:hypothetical protein
MKLACCAAVLVGLLVSPALAGVVVSFNPVHSYVDQGQTFWVDVVADIPANEPIIGWGFDLAVANPAIAAPTGNITFGPNWNAAPGDPLDPYAALAFPDGIAGNGVLLVSIEFQAQNTDGTTALNLSATPGDLTEGFMIAPPVSQLAEVTFNTGAITVPVPEPVSFVLLALGALLRRR